MTQPRVVIVGAGPGGLSAAMLLSAQGFHVEVVEAQGELGGRSSGFELGPYRFDTGSTMVMMPFVFEELFVRAGTSLAREVELMPVEPMYHLDFGTRALDVHADEARMHTELERFSPGAGRGLSDFLRNERLRLEHLYPVLQRSWPSLVSMASPTVFAALPHVGLNQSLYEATGRYFEDEQLRLAFSFQSAYLGMSPWDCPAGFCMVPYVEHAWGIDHVRGGVHALCDAMGRVAERNGARIRKSRAVKKLLISGDRCHGAELEDGTRLEAEAVIINADATNALLNLTSGHTSLRFNRMHLRHLAESCSTFLLYLGLDTTLPLRHHTFLFARDYESEMRRVFREGVLADDLSLYVCNPSVTDPSLAPPGHSALYALALVPNTRFPIDWHKETPALRDRILSRIGSQVGFDVSPHIQVEAILSPRDWEQRYQVSHGAVFGPAHRIDQLLAFRLPNRLPHPRGVYLAGGGTSPGSGLPTIVESGRIAARLICEDRGIAFPPPWPLPPPGRSHRHRRAS